jgi:predicted AAA+ superfamily ATPase
VYRKPERFFERTYLTQSLMDLAAQAIRRLSGEKTEMSAIFNMATQFGGGKTHALTLLYHLATHGPAANRWMGVRKLLDKSGMSTVPQAAVAVFVGTEFDSLSGRGGDDGTPVRKTPWGEIAFQLGGAEALAVLAEHEKQLTAPAGDIIRKFLPKDTPCLILMDELMNYVSRNRKSGMATQLYNFLQNLSEEARGHNHLILVVSIPASELEMNAEDHSDYERFKKMLDRLGKAVMMSAEAETSEIIRRRLFEWDERAVSQDGKVLLSRDALQTCSEYAAWVVEHRHQLPDWFPIDHARDVFAATYPFHPLVLSVFERKWQALPRFQRTRGILRLLALWVSRAYQEGFKGAQRDVLIGLGTAPLDDPFFRAATFEQLGEPRLEAAVTTDICGKRESHATRLDREAVDTIKKRGCIARSRLPSFLNPTAGSYRPKPPSQRFAWRWRNPTWISGMSRPSWRRRAAPATSSPWSAIAIASAFHRT